MALDIVKFNSVVNEATNFLIPYFKLPEWKRAKILPPKFEESTDGIPYYKPRTDTFIFRPNDFNKREVIGHEVGHRIHFHINPKFWENGGLSIYSNLLMESVAYYAEKIYINQGEVLDNPIISLSTLARQDYCFYSKRESQKIMKSLIQSLGLTKMIFQLEKREEERGII